MWAKTLYSLHVIFFVEIHAEIFYNFFSYRVYRNVLKFLQSCQSFYPLTVNSGVQNR